MASLAREIGSIVADIQNTRYSELSSSAIIVFDHLITFDQEVEHVWSAPWTIGKTLFLVNRYYTLFVVTFNNYGLFSSNLTNSFCTKFLEWQGWSGLIACALAEITLQLRLYALYYGNKRIVALMLCSFITVMAISAAIMGTTLHGTKIEANLIPGIPFCIPIGTSKHFYAFWIPILSFETLLCFLALFRGYMSYKDQELRLRLRRRKAQRLGNASYQERRAATLLEILLPDSVAYFIVMFATYFTTVMIWILRPSSDVEIPIGFTVAMSCVCCNRLLLNLRGSEHGRQGRNISASVQGHGGSRKSQTHLSIAEDRVGSLANSETEDIDADGDGLGEYELHKLRTLKPTRSAHVV